MTTVLLVDDDPAITENLGLPLVRAVVARHGGTVSLRSRDGEGTVVTIRIPVYQG